MRSQHSQVQKQKERPRFKTKQWGSNIKEEENEQIKMHIYNFFITEGHIDLANSFAKQANLKIKPIDQQTVKKRLYIKNLIKANQFDEAIKQIEAFDEKLVEDQKQTELIFTIKCLKVINLIKQKKIEEAILRAKELLIPYVQKHFAWIQRVEQVMSLIAFINEKECLNKQLLQDNYKNKVADDVNSFMLGNKSKESLKILLNLGRWLQKRLDLYAGFPHLSLWSNDIFKP